MSDAQPLPSIDVYAAYTAGPEVVLLDVRERNEWDAGHAARAVNLPLSELAERAAELDVNRATICICKSGGRSGRATAYLAQLGVPIVNMTGGMLAWAEMGLPIVTDDGTPGGVL